ncbi:MAG: hypothetical protein K0U98_17315 [Deltaproteobacteria bacterium]|nr:hypothetical protein [Deltaproteobacteria bacterium]
MKFRLPLVLLAVPLFALLILFGTLPIQAQEPGTVISTQLRSKILGETRSYRVHMPATYRAFPTTRYPVLYMVDGDYNFHYVSGLLEQMSTISEQIPEVILVGISDQGTTSYRRNMKPSLGKKDSGTATQFLDFLEKELIPKVESQYRTADFRMLAGHSLGGLFTVNALLERPALFDALIAISPSLWWDNQALVRHAKKAFRTPSTQKAYLYLTLASEKEMGVKEMVKLLEKSAPPSLHWKFRHFTNESHDSTGLPSLRWAFLDIFAGYELTEELYFQTKGAEDILDHFQQVQKRHGVEFLLPPVILGRILYSYHRKDRLEEIAALESGIRKRFPASLPVFQLAKANLALETQDWQEALSGYQSFIEAFPGSFEGYWGAAKAHHGLGEMEAAHQKMNRAQRLATRGAARRWRLNQLEADRRSLNLAPEAPEQ